MGERRTPSGLGRARASRPASSLSARGTGARGSGRRDPGYRDSARRDSTRRESARRDTPRGGADPRARASRPRLSDARGGTRPTAARRTGGEGGIKRTSAPRPKRMSGRATVLGLLLLGLALAYAYPVRVYLAQQAEIDQMRQDQQDQRDRIAGLMEQISKWQDDEYVIAQARRRLHYVRPGEVAYVIVDDPSVPAQQPGTGQSVNTGPWFSQLWSNLQAADNPRQK